MPVVAKRKDSVLEERYKEPIELLRSLFGDVGPADLISPLGIAAVGGKTLLQQLAKALEVKAVPKKTLLGAVSEVTGREVTSSKQARELLNLPDINKVIEDRNKLFHGTVFGHSIEKAGVIKTPASSPGKGFVSTTRNPAVARDFGPRVFEIDPKKVKTVPHGEPQLPGWMHLPTKLAEERLVGDIPLSAVTNIYNSPKATLQAQKGLPEKEKEAIMKLLQQIAVRR